MENKKALNDEELQAVAGGGGNYTMDEYEKAFYQTKPERCPICREKISQYIEEYPNANYGEAGYQWKCPECGKSFIIGVSGTIYT